MHIYDKNNKCKKNFEFTGKEKKFALCKHGNSLNEVLLSARIFL